MTDAPNLPGGSAAPVLVDGTKPTPRPPAAGDGATWQTPEQRRAADEAARIAADPWADPNKVAIRNADGSVTFKDKGAGDAADPTKRPEPVRTQDGSKFVFGEGLELTEQQIRDLVEHKTATDAKRLSAPQTAQDFKVELPTNLKLPAGMEFKLDPNSPMVGPAREFASVMDSRSNSFPSSLVCTRRAQPARWRASTPRALLKSPS
jgi:hypothetical protein